MLGGEGEMHQNDVILMEKINKNYELFDSGKTDQFGWFICPTIGSIDLKSVRPLDGSNDRISSFLEWFK